MTYQPVIRSQAELEAAWRHLMQPLGFAGESLWFMFIGPGDLAFPHLTQLEDADVPPCPEELTTLSTFLAGLHRDLGKDLPSPGMRIAFLRSRPGGGGPNTRDRLWAHGLYAACREAGLPCEVVHLATDHDVHPLPWDDVSAAVPA